MGRSDYATGCDQYLVQPQIPKEAKETTEYPESRWFDDARLDVVGEGISIEDVQAKKPGCDYGSAPAK